MPFTTTLPDIQTETGYERVPVQKRSDQIKANQQMQIAQLGVNLAVKGAETYQKSRLETDVQQSADVVTAISAAQEELGGQQVFTDTGDIRTEGLSPDLQTQIARVKEEAGDKFGRIANAVRQGALPENAAALETEATMRRLINQTPGFSQEIKQLARDLVGFDPTGYSLRKILDVDKPAKAKTAQQKRFEEAQVMQDGLQRIGKNLDMDTLLGNLALRDSLKLEQEITDSQLELGTVSLRQWAQTSYVEKGPDLNQVMTKVIEMGAEGGIQDPAQYTTAIEAQREVHKNEFRRQVSLKGGMDTQEMTQILTQIDSLYEPLINSVKNNEMGKLLETRIDLIAKTHQMWGKQATPRLTRIVDAYGPTIGGQLLEMMSNIADPKQFELIYQFDPGLKELIEGGQIKQTDVADGVEQVVTKITKGEQLTEDDLRFRHLTETMVTQPGNKELREKYVRGLGEAGSPIRATSILATKVPRTQATPDEVKFIKDQYQVYVGTPATEDIPGNLINSVARELLDLNPEGLRGELQLVPETGRTTRQFFMGLPGKATGRSKVVIPFDPTLQGGTVNWQTTSMKKLQTFIDAATLQGYAAEFGVDPVNFPNELMSRITTRMDGIRAEQIETAKLDAVETQENSMYFDIYNPSAVMGWALPENKPQGAEAQAKADQDLTNLYVDAVRMAESGGDPDAVSAKGALGEMQVMPSTATDPYLERRGLRLAKRNPDGTFDKKDLARFGRDYFKLQLQDFGGDFEAALIAYNAGPGNAQKWLKAGRDYSVLPKRSETEPYVKRAMGFLNELSKGGDES